MAKKEVFTRIDEDLYYKIKEKGYKFSELIRLGYEYKENNDQILNKEYIDKIVNELKDISKDLRNIVLQNKYIKDRLEELRIYINHSKTKISSRFWPSKYDMISILDTINKKIDDIFSYLK